MGERGVCWKGLQELEPAVRGFLARRCRDASEVDDVVQETLLRAARYRGSLGDPARLRGWLLRIAGNALRDRVRRECRFGRAEVSEEGLEHLAARERPPGLPEEAPLLRVGRRSVDRDDALDHMRRALRELRDADRQVLGSFYSGSGTCRTTGLECGIAPGLVKVRLFRARRRLARAMQRSLARTLLIVPIAQALPASGGQEPGPPPPRLESSRAQLEHARELKLAMRGTRGRERARRRMNAAEAYRVVRRYFPEERGLGGEAAFRAGELLRAGGEERCALEEFRVARELSDGGEFAFRASLEIGHLLRRRGDPSGALDAYLDVIADARAEPRWCDDAAIWAGRVWYEMKQVEEARRWWNRVAEGGEDPCDRVRAYDQLALALIDEGDLEGAAGVLDVCRRRLSDVALEETPRGERTRNALTNMRAVDALRIAIARRRDGVRIDGRE